MIRLFSRRDPRILPLGSRVPAALPPIKPPCPREEWRLAELRRQRETGAIKARLFAGQSRNGI